MKGQKTFFESMGADFSECRRYRYRLFRLWNINAPRLLFVMLNPSTADEWQNDPTVARCQTRAEQLGFGYVEVVNLFAWRSTDPRALRKVEDPVGPLNDQSIRNAAKASDMVICGWGNHGLLQERGNWVRDLIFEAGHIPQALKLNDKTGQPCHPLYLPYSAKPFPMVNA